MISTEPTESRRSRKLAMLACVLVLGVILPALLVTSLLRESVTFDEPFFIAGGYSYLTTGDSRFANWTNPVFASVWVGLPTLLLDLKPADQIAGWEDKSDFVYANAFLTENRTAPETVVRAARLPVVLLAVLLGLGVFAWSYELWGPRGAVLSLVLCAFSPNILAHGGLATSDIPLTASFFFALYFWWSFVRRGRLWSVPLAGLFLALALLTKLSAVVLVAVILISAAVEVLSPGIGAEGTRPTRSRTAGRLVLALVVAFLLAGVLIWTSYRFDTTGGSVATAQMIEHLSAAKSDASWQLNCVRAIRWLPLPPRYVDSAAFFISLMRDGHDAFFCGEYRTHGWWSYFPVAFLIKTTIPFLLLLAAGLVVSLRRGRDVFHLLLGPTLFFALSMASPVNMGFRHVLPVMPFLFVLCGAVIPRRATGTFARVALVAVVLLAGWHVTESLCIWPDYLAYFNEFAGGPNGGHRYLVDSNLDWGQAVGRVGTRLKELGITGKVKLAVFSRTLPEAPGVEFEGVPLRVRPEPGVWVVSATELEDCYSADKKRFAWLRDNFKPVGNVGHSIYIYRITPEDLKRLEPGGRS